MTATKYQLVYTVEGRMTADTFTEEQVFPAMEIRGYPFTKLSTNTRVRAELQGQPMFKGCAGPMWGGFDAQGNPVVRYETTAVNDRLSA